MIMDYVYPCFIAAIASFGFCIILNVKDIKVGIIASLNAGLGWLIYLIAGSYVGVVGKNLLAAITITFLAEFLCRMVKTPATIFIIVGILPLVPGGGLYYTMEYCIQGNQQMFVTKGMETLAVAGAIAVGVSFASALYKLFIYAKLKIKEKLE